MPTIQDRKKHRTEPRPGGADSEPHVPDHDPADLADDQADSGPDRDREDPGN